MSALAAASHHTDVGSPEAYSEVLYERHHRAIFAFCLNRLRRREDADDAVQLTFMYALLSLRRGVVPELELPWLFTIARNVCSTRRRNGKRRGEFESLQDLDAIQEKLAVPERRDVAGADDFSAALRGIPENQRKAILLREWQGLSYDEISTELGLSRGATEALLFRARQNVARRLEAVKALQGLPLLSFLRNLFQSATAKTIAVGAGAAMTVVAVPSSDSYTPPATAPRATPVVHTTSVRPDVSRPGTEHAAPRTRSSARRDVGGRVTGRDVGQPARAGDAAGTGDVSVSTPAVTGTSTSSPSTGSTSSPQVPVTTDTPAQVVNTVDTVVNTVSNAVSNVELPTPSLPVTPPVSLPAPPTPPSVHLP